MIRKSIFTAMLAAAVLGMAGCSPKKPAAAEEREKWLDSLNDSIALYQKQTEEVNAALAASQATVGELIGSFDYVNHAREVEGYHIYQGWQGRYPLMTTGLVARVTESEGLELIATLTGAHFNEIAAMSEGETVQSDVVAHDQALNYRAGNLNTVCFSGNKADSIGALIASHEGASVNIVYLNGNRTGSLTLPADEKRMIAATWRLYNAQKVMHENEKELSRLAGKINACRRILASREVAEENAEDENSAEENATE